MELDRTAVLANDHQHINRRGTGRGFPLARQHVNVDVAIRAETPAHRAACDVFSEEKFVDLSFREVACFSGRISFHCGGISHRNHRGVIRYL